MTLCWAVTECFDGLATSEFKSSCIGTLFSRVPAADAEIGPTLMVILTALIVEYLPLSPLSPTALLRGLGSRVGSYGGAYISEVFVPRNVAC